MNVTRESLHGRKCALVIAHPGHELRVHHWVETARPTVFVLTDGSGRTERSRLGSTRAVLARAGAPPARLFGRFTDAGIYRMFKDDDRASLSSLAHELIGELSALSVEYVVADALEGFNPSHDLCRFLINAFVALHGTEGRELANFDFLLDGRPDADPSEQVVALDLDEEALDRKLSAAEGYPELLSEVRSALQRFGRQAFATETLRPVANLHQGLERMPEEPPYYETFGERQVRAGFYRDVIRYRDHVRPVVRALWSDLGLPISDGPRPLRQD